MSDCIFCHASRVAGQAPASMVYRDAFSTAFVDTLREPVNPGHLLVVPLVHTADLAVLDVDTGAHLMRVAQRLARAVRQSGVRCDGFGFRFGPHYANRPPRAALEQVATDLRRVL